MAYVAPTTRSDGYVVDASEWNKNTVDNPIALRTGAVAIASQATGDLVVASSSSQLGVVADVAVGQVLASGGVGAAPAYTATPSVSGVAFPSTQVPSTNANTLDDYEEGTWTPVIGGSGGTSGQSYNSQVGSYIKIGQLVWAFFYVELSAKGTITTNVQIQGLPFTVQNVGSNGAPSPIRWAGLATSWINVIALAAPNTTTANVVGNTAAATNNATALATADIQNNTNFTGCILFRATA